MRRKGRGLDGTGWGTIVQTMRTNLLHSMENSDDSPIAIWNQSRSFTLTAMLNHSPLITQLHLHILAVTHVIALEWGFFSFSFFIGCKFKFKNNNYCSLSLFSGLLSIDCLIFYTATWWTKHHNDSLWSDLWWGAISTQVVPTDKQLLQKGFIFFPLKVFPDVL